MFLRELSGEQRRQLIDSTQVFESWREADDEKKRRFTGGVRWVARGNKEYLLRKSGAHEASLGRRSEETELAYKAFLNGRESNRAKLKGLSDRLNDLAPVNRAMGLGRLPTIAARIIRRCDDKGLLGQKLFVVGTNALYAYEALAGVQIGSDLVATADIDLLHDSRTRLSLAARETLKEKGLIGLLQRVDGSFSARPRNFRASNKDGYLVDLIRPQPSNVFRDAGRRALTDLPDDLEGAPIQGLAWLINAPKTEAVVLDERGYPARLVVNDPRVFALHKAWVAERKDREPVKATRDKAQAETAAIIATRYLQMSFDSPDLAALPRALRAVAPALLDTLEKKAGGTAEQPDW